MWNDLRLQAELLEIFEDERDAFRWLFSPLPCLNHRTPIEVISSGGVDRVLQVLGRFKWGIPE